MTDTVTTYDPSHSITYRHPCGNGTNYRTHVLARLAHRRAVDSVSVTSYRTGERQGRDPLTGERVTLIDPATVIPVRSEPLLAILSASDRHAAL